MGLLILLLLVVGAVWLYGRLRRMEGEILSEIELEKERRRRESAPSTDASRNVELDQNASLEDRILAVISSMPGCSQAEIYTQFPDSGKDSLQKVLRTMAQDGLVRRERKGSSYKLFAV